MSFCFLASPVLKECYVEFLFVAVFVEILLRMLYLFVLASEQLCGAALRHLVFGCFLLEQVWAVELRLPMMSSSL